jgi:hemoglobin
MTAPSLYDRMGGAPTIQAMAEVIYRKMMGDPELAGFFANVYDVPGQISHHAAYMTSVLGGPDEYHGRDLRTAHGGLAGLSDVHFDKVLVHLTDTLHEVGVPADVIPDVVTVADSARAEVLGR